MKPIPAIIFTLLIFLNAAPFARSATITVTSIADSGPGSLRNALASAASGDTIDATGVSGPILLTGGELVVTKSLTILGPGPTNLAVFGYNSRVFLIASNTVVNISGLTVRNGHTPGGDGYFGGGGIYNDHATLAISNCMFANNISSDGGPGSSGSGGGIVNDGSASGTASLLIINSILSLNSTAWRDGAGIYNNGEWGGSATVTILNSTLVGNSAGGNGGGVYNDGLGGTAMLTVSNCTLSGNSALDGGGIANAGGTLAIFNSSIISNSVSQTSGLGGGIYNGGPLIITNSTLSGNSARLGGGIYNAGTLTIANSTLAGNSAKLGGGIDNGGTLAIANSTLSGNSATGEFGMDGGAILNEGVLTIFNSTLSGNSATIGGGIFNGGGAVIAALEVGNTILNAGALGPTITNTSGTVTSDGYNLSSDGGGGYLIQPTDLINTNPMLGPLQDNGGPTWTHALKPGSPAIDAGNGFGLAADQRGRARTVDLPYVANAAGGDGSDIGAFELNPPVLNIAQFGGYALLFWSTSDPGYVLQSTGSLSPPAWTPFPGNPAVVGDQYIAVDSVLNRQFYRLMQ